MYDIVYQDGEILLLQHFPHVLVNVCFPVPLLHQHSDQVVCVIHSISITILGFICEILMLLTLIIVQSISCLVLVWYHTK